MTLGATQFVGWDGTGSGGPKHLDIKNMWGPTNNINFFTNGNNQRMTILGATGFVGICNGAFVPQNLLHLNSIGPQNVYSQWTNSSTGNGAGNGLLIGVSGFNGTSEIRNQNNTPIE